MDATRRLRSRPGRKARSSSRSRAGHRGQGTVDVWWRGKDNGPLMVMLAHLLVKHEDWRGQRLRLLRVVDNEAAVEDTGRHLHDLLENARIRAEVQIVVDKNPIEAIHRTSESAAVTFLGFALPDEEQAPTEFLARTEELLTGLGTVFLVHSAGNVQLEV